MHAVVREAKHITDLVQIGDISSECGVCSALSSRQALAVLCVIARHKVPKQSLVSFPLSGIASLRSQ